MLMEPPGQSPVIKKANCGPNVVVVWLTGQVNLSKDECGAK